MQVVATKAGSPSMEAATVMEPSVLMVEAAEALASLECLPDFPVRLLSDISRLLANLSRHQQPAVRRHISLLWSNEPPVLTNLTGSVAYVAKLPFSDVAELLAYFASVLANLAILLSHIPNIQPYIAGASWRYLTVL
jgi:hypothetical protein